MGRRYWLILGILLLVPPATRPARAQDGVPPMPEAPGSPGDLPPARPLPIPVAEGGLEPVGEAKPVPGEPPAVDEKAGRRPTPPRDPRVNRVDAGAEGQPPASGKGPASPDEPDGPSAERLPAGKQSVAVTVDVRSPANMNLHQPAEVRINLRNTGTADAMQVRVRDELPDGLKFLSSEPAPDRVDRDSVLSWSLPRLPAGSEKVIVLKVEPVKAGDLEHGASVWFQTGSGAATRVLQPHLKVEQVASGSSVLKGHTVEFRIKVTNDGDGPARDVRVVARLSERLRYGSGGRGDSEVVTDPIPVLGPGQSEELDPLIADAIQEGPATCTVTATSRDVVVRNKDEEARNVAAVKVVEPKLEVAVSGQERRPTESLATYEIAVANPGTAPARKVRVSVLVPPGTRLMSVPEDARYDSSSRRLQWSIDKLEPGSTPQKLGLELKVGEVGKFEVAAEAIGTGLKAKGRLVTEVFAMPDVDLNVSERNRVVDVGGKTTFLVRLRNYGTKEATNIRLKGTLSKNLKFHKFLTSDEVPPDVEAFQKGEQILFAKNHDKTEAPAIPRLGPGKEMVIGLEVEVTGDDPKLATLHVTATHDDLNGDFEDMAGFRVLAPSSRRGEPAGASTPPR